MLNNIKASSINSNSIASNTANQNNSVETNQFSPTYNIFLSYLNKEVKLPDDFESNYETWLDEEVFSNKIDWDLVLDTNAASNTIILFKSFLILFVLEFKHSNYF